MRFQTLQKFIVTFLFLIVAASGFTQSTKFTLLQNYKNSSPSLSAYIKKGAIASFKKGAFTELLQTNPASFVFSFQFENKEWELLLEKSELFSKGFFVTTGSNPAEKLNFTQHALHYKGSVKGKPYSLAAVSIVNGKLVAVIADEQLGNINIGAINTPEAKINEEHIIYRDADLIIKNEFICGFADDQNQGKSPIPVYAPVSPMATTINPEPVDIYFEADYTTYLNNNSTVTDVVNYVTALFNVVQVIYDKDSVNTKISAIKVWNIVDPYNSLGTTSSVLNAFSGNMANGFPGDLAHFLSQRGLGGGIAYLGVLCSSNSVKTGVSGNLSNSFNLFPIYSWSSMVITHELGHNLGSPHTQSCSWPGGAIDNCAPPEGSCPPGPAPVNGGTIMSYCHNTDYKINLANGFGPLPGQRIRDLVRNSTCIFPGVYFETTSITVPEAGADTDNGCLDYKLVTTKLKIPYEPTQPATINLILNAGAGLVIGSDKDIEVTPLNFTLDGSNLSQTINLKVYNDAIIENQESLTIDFSINANGGNALKQNFFLPAVINITSDDYRPDSTSNIVLYYEPFDGISSGLGNWTQTINYGNLSPNRWVIGNSGDPDFNSKAVYISNNGTALAYSGFSLNDSAIVRIESPLIDANTFSNLQLTYLYKCAGESKSGQGGLSGGQWLDYGKVYFSIDGGISWLLLKENIGGRNAKVTESLTLPPSANNATNFRIAFEWLNNSSIVNNPPFIIDSIVITGASVSPIQSDSEPGNIDEEYVGPFQTVHFYNPISKNIIATIENTSAFDFGCTKVELVRTGAGATQAWGTFTDQKISDKVVKITPANINESAPYTIKLYYTNEEINGWLASTGNKLSDVRIVKTMTDLTLPIPISPPSYSSINTRENFGLAQHSVVSGTFTGFSSFAIMKAFSVPECQGTLINYSAGITGSAYQWQVNNGTGYSAISNDAIYSNATTGVITLANPPISFIDYQYRCLVNTTYGIVYSSEFKLKYGTTWLGTVSNAWENALNWSCGTLPDSKTDIIINGGTPFTPQLGSDITIRSLRLPGSSNLIIKSGFHLTVKQ